MTPVAVLRDLDLLDPAVFGNLPRPQREEVLALLEERAIQGPRGNNKAIPIIAEDEAEARPLAGKADGAALTALREDTPHW